MCSKLRCDDDRRGVWPCGSRPVLRGDDELDLVEASRFCETYSGCIVRPYGLRLAAQDNKQLRHRCHRDRYFFRKEDLIEWMESWEYAPPACLQISRPGTRIHCEPPSQFRLQFHPRYFVRVRHGKPDAQA